MMSSDLPSSGSSFSDVSSETDPAVTINTILAHAENVCVTSQTCVSEWLNELHFAERKICKDVHNEIQKAITLLLQWETKFRIEISEIYSNYSSIVREGTTEIHSLQDELNKRRIATMGCLRTSLEHQDVPFQEANELLQMTTILEEKMRYYSVFPRVSFNAVYPFTEERCHKFWYLATLDILPHQLTLQHYSEITLGTVVFVIDIAHPKFVSKLPMLLKCTLEVERTSGLQELKPEINEGHLNIVVNITCHLYHTVNVQLYDQHICGSPFTFFPSFKSDPLAVEQCSTEEQCCSSLKPQENYLTLDKDSSFSSSDDDDYMMDSPTYQCRRQTLSRAGIARVNSFLGEAALDRANETSANNILKSQEESKPAGKMWQKESSVYEKQIAGLESNSLDNVEMKSQKTDQHISKKSKEKSSFEKAVVAVQNVMVKSQETGQHVIKGMQKQSSVSEEAVVESKNIAVNTNDSFKMNEMAASGKVEDLEEGEECQSKPLQKVESTGHTANTEQTTTAQMIISGVELMRRMELDDSMNNTRDEPEDPVVFTPKVAPRKPLGLIQPLRRPRAPSVLSSVPGVYNHKCETLKSKEGIVDDLALLCNNPENAGTSISDVDFKKIAEVPQKTAQTVELCKEEPKRYEAVESRDTCSGREDLYSTGLDKIENFAMSDTATPDQKDDSSHEAEGKKPTFLVTKSSKYQNVNPAKLSGNFVMKLYGPCDDPLFQPIGVAELHDKKVVVADTFNNRMALFSSRGVFIRYLNTVHLQRPSAVVVLRDGNFAVTENRGIVIFRENGDFLKTLKIPLKRPFGLTILEDGNLLTIETTGKGFMTLVTVNPDSGYEISRVRVDLKLPKNCHKISKPRFITYHRHGRVLVVDLGLNCIYVIDITQGTLLSVFGGEGSDEGHFRDPSGIACDSDGYIVVGDSRNHRVQVFDPYGHFLCILAADIPPNRPSGICLTSSGELLVVNYWDQSVVRYLLTN